MRSTTLSIFLILLVFSSPMTLTAETSTETTPKMNPYNGALRFGLEVTAWLGMGAWGYQQANTDIRYVYMIGVPALSMLAWFLFNVPNDPSRSGKAPIRVPGWVRLSLELATFSFGIFALQQTENTIPAIALGGGTVLHYAISYKRIDWLLRQ